MSTPNTRTQPYLSVFNTSPACKSSKDKIDSKCKPAKKGDKASTAWMVPHCEGLMLKPTTKNVKAIARFFSTDVDAVGLKPKASGDAATYLEGLAVSKKNPCVKARRCQLVPYKETKTAEVAEKGGKGCCPGQTGHHPLPEEIFPEGDDCYTDETHGNAPTICVEGVNNSHGSHGKIHSTMDALMTNHIQKAKTDQISNAKAINAGAKSVKLTFPGCDETCTKQQLRAFYQKLCEGKTKPRGGLGGKGKSKAEAAKLAKNLSESFSLR